MKTFQSRLLFSLILLLAVNMATATDYYLSPSGNDQNQGTSPEKAWKSLSKIYSASLNPGDRVLLEGGSIFQGSIYLDESVQGTLEAPVIISSYGTGKATIDAGNNYGIYAQNNGGITINNLIVKGSGRSTNTSSGILFYIDTSNQVFNNIRIDNIDVYGFQKTGILIGTGSTNCYYNNIEITNSLCHDNGEAGIKTFGTEKYGIKNIKITHCKVYNNSGRSEITTNHTGNGILLGYADKALIEHCEAYNNGYLNNNDGGGPVGIWCYESNNVIIQYNYAHHNSSGNGADGGGFDIDGGTTNSVLQYNYSSDNDGAGYLVAQYKGASEMYNNIIRYNISENDGRKSGYGGITLWAGDPFSKVKVYNNTVYTNNDNVKSHTPACVSLFSGVYTDVEFYNNIFISTGGALQVISYPDNGRRNVIFENNLYYSPDYFSIKWDSRNYSSLKEWSTDKNQELNKNGELVGIQENPNLYIQQNSARITSNLTDAFIPAGNSPAIDAGLNLTEGPHFEPVGENDAAQRPIPSGNGFDIGALEANVVTNLINPLKQKEEIIIFPNPLKDHLIVTSEKYHRSDLSYKIFNMLGAVINSGQIREGSSIELNCEPGLYVISFYLNGEEVSSQKIVVH